MDGVLHLVSSRPPIRRHTPLPVETSCTSEQANDQVLLRVDSINKQYADQVVLADVAFDIQAGEIIGIIGPCRTQKKDATIQRHTDWHRKLKLYDGRSKMQTAPEITFEGSETSDAARAQIVGEIERMEQHNQRITGCRVTVIAPSRKHRHGTGFQVNIWLTIPPHEKIVVNNSASNDSRHEHAEVAIKDAFAAARRQVDALAA